MMDSISLTLSSSSLSSNYVQAILHLTHFEASVQLINGLEVAFAF